MKRKSIYLAVLFTICLLLSNQSKAQWISLSTNQSWDAVHIISPDTVLEFGISGLIRKTTNAGVNWVTQTVGTVNYLRSWFLNHTTGWVCSDSKLIRTTDAGGTWIDVPVGFTNNNAIYDGYFWDINNGILCGTTYMWRTTNGGTTWSTILSIGGSPNVLRKFCFINPNTGFVVGQPGYIFRTTDAGNNWVSISDLSGTDFKCVSFVDINTGWVASAQPGSGNYITKTTNSGVTWVQTPSGSAEILDIKFADANTGWFYESVPSTLAKTTNGGATWFAQVSNLSFPAYCIDLLDNNNVWFCGYGLTYKTTNGGVPVPFAPTNLSANAAAGRIMNLSWTNPVPAPTNIYVYRGYDNNLTQYAILSGGSTTFQDTGLVNNVIYNYRVYASNSYGLSGPSNLASDTSFSASGTLSVINRETGNFSIPANGTLTRTLNFTALDHSLVNSITDVNILIDSLAHPNISDLEITLVHNGITDTLFYHNGGTGQNMLGTYFTGSGTTLIQNGSAPYRGFYIPLKSLSQFNAQDFVGAWSLNIKNTAPGNTGTLYSWSINVQYGQLTNIQNNNNEIPSGFGLSQNYPNPFNPSTKIRFDIPKDALTRLSIFDINGREVSIVVNKHLSAGSYEITFDASKLSSGLYFYKLEAGTFSAVKKMILLK